MPIVGLCACSVRVKRNYQNRNRGNKMEKWTQTDEMKFARMQAESAVGRSRENISAPVRREMFNHMRANASHLRDSIDAAMKAAALSDDGAAEDETTVAVELPVSVVKALLASMGEKGDE